MIGPLAHLTVLIGNALTAFGEVLGGDTPADQATSLSPHPVDPYDFVGDGRMECDGPDATEAWHADGGPTEWMIPDYASPISAHAVDHRSALVEPAPQAPGADRSLPDPAALLRDAAGYLDAIWIVWDRSHRDQLVAGLRDLAAQFDADERS